MAFLNSDIATFCLEYNSSISETLIAELFTAFCNSFNFWIKSWFACDNISLLFFSALNCSCKLIIWFTSDKFDSSWFVSSYLFINPLSNIFILFDCSKITLFNFSIFSSFSKIFFLFSSFCLIDVFLYLFISFSLSFIFPNKNSFCFVNVSINESFSSIILKFVFLNELFWLSVLLFFLILLDFNFSISLFKFEFCKT